MMTKLSSSPMTTAQRIEAPSFLPGEPQSFIRKLSLRSGSSEGRRVTPMELLLTISSRSHQSPHDMLALMDTSLGQVSRWRV